MTSKTTTTTTNPTEADAPVQVEHLDPTTLLVDVNVRHDTRLDPAFLGSVADLGVLVPIVAVRTTDGGVRVRYGHRRTLAAIEAKRTTVPVVIVGTDADTDAEQVARIISQHAENEHRAGLSNAERADVVHQLSAFGVSAAQIVKRTRTPRPEVDAALVVSGSTLAKAATARYDFLDLMQAAVVAEFEDDTDTVKALVVAAQTGRFAHVAQRARDDRERANRLAAFTTALTEAGVQVLDTTTARPLSGLRGADDQVLTPENHGDCPGNGVTVTHTYGYLDPTTGYPPVTDPDAEQGDQVEDHEVDGDDEPAYDDKEEPADQGLVWGCYPEATAACADPDAHGHRARHDHGTGSGTRKVSEMSEAEAEVARAARRDVIDSNKAWKASEVVRRDYLRTLLTRKTPPKGSATLVATALATYPHSIVRDGGNNLAADLLGVAPGRYGRSEGVATLVATATEGRAHVLTLALVLAGLEDTTHVGSWRNVDGGTRAYLEFLASTGYTLSDVERRACGQDPLPIDAETVTA